MKGTHFTVGLCNTKEVEEVSSTSLNNKFDSFIWLSKGLITKKMTLRFLIKKQRLTFTHLQQHMGMNL